LSNHPAPAVPETLPRQLTEFNGTKPGLPKTALLVVNMVPIIAGLALNFKAAPIIARYHVVGDKFV